MGRFLRCVFAFSLITVLGVRPGRAEARPLAQDRAHDPSPGGPAPSEERPIESGDAARLAPEGAREVSSAALPDKPQPNFDEGIGPPGSFLPELDPAQKPAPAPEAKRERKRNKRAWLLLVLAQHSAAGFDAYTTQLSVDKGGRELDPLMRPFGHSGAIYPAIQAGPIVLDFLGYRMMTSRKRWARRIWWLPQTAATAGFLWTGGRNLSVLFHLSHRFDVPHSTATEVGVKIRRRR